MNDPRTRISGNATQQQLLSNLEGAKSLLCLFKLAENLGIHIEELRRMLEEVPGLSQKTLELVYMPDRFNDHFAERGWIAHESLNTDLAQRAIKFADAGKFDEAEQILVDYHNDETLDFTIRRGMQFNAFRPRWEIVQTAKEDYLRGRYYSAIPLILMTIDRFVNDIEQTGFFTDRTDLTAWDSIAAHSSGLKRLAAILNRSRKRTTTEPLTLLYRNGILHGRDLGYGNKAVAAKAWAALSAIFDWASAVEEGRKQAPQPTPKPSLAELLVKLSEIEEIRRKTEAWKPRSISVGTDIPETGASDEYKPGSPEQALAGFLAYWKVKNYGKMALLLCDFSGRASSKRAGEVRETYGPHELAGFRLVDVHDDAPAVTVVRVVLKCSKHGKSSETEVSLRMFYQNENGEPRAYPFEDASWVIFEAGFNEVIYAR